MRSLVLEKYNEFILRETEIPKLKSGWVLIKVEACGICGSDVHGMDGSTGRRQPPVIMGHEASGIIQKVAPDVSGWKVNDRVTFDSTISCGECFYCNRGEINLCENRRVLGVSCDEYRQNGAFAEFVAVPAHILYAIPENISFEQAAMIEAVSIAVHATAISSVQPNDAAVVIGCGMIGLLCIQALKAAGCGKVIAIDQVNEKLQLAKELGADLILKSTDSDLIQMVLNETRQRGADLVFEVVGIEPTVNLAIDCTRKGGTVTLIGNLAPEVRFPLQKVVTRQLKVQGSCASAGEYPLCLDLIASGKIKVDRLISAVAPLEDGNEWFHRLYNKEAGLMKVILKP
ncbi:MAG TPA: galactitol-1-phosphate 5-dehydrogenase [Prolixibacteraceae bacterium]|nr:galactitol-1-phosphate 5-dehydrogenase [Prolixibacteraceae bacterium]